MDAFFVSPFKRNKKNKINENQIKNNTGSYMEEHRERCIELKIQIIN